MMPAALTIAYRPPNAVKRRATIASGASALSRRRRTGRRGLLLSRLASQTSFKARGSRPTASTAAPILRTAPPWRRPDTARRPVTITDLHSGLVAQFEQCLSAEHSPSGAFMKQIRPGTAETLTERLLPQGDSPDLSSYAFRTRDSARRLFSSAKWRGLRMSACRRACAGRVGGVAAD